MKVGDVIKHNGIKYTITCFYAPIYVNGVQLSPSDEGFNYKVTKTLNDILGYENR